MAPKKEVKKEKTVKTKEKSQERLPSKVQEKEEKVRI